MKRLVLFATPLEAKGFILKTEARGTSNPSLFIYGEGKIVIAGWGSYAAMAAVFNYGGDVDEIYNLGFAGSLRSHGVGEFIKCHVLGKYIYHPSTLDKKSLKLMGEGVPTLSLAGKDQGRLITSDFPIHSEELRGDLGKNWDLVDMEGYGVAFAAQRMHKPCHVYKIVSDFAKPGGRDLIEKHSHDLSSALSMFAEDLLRN